MHQYAARVRNAGATSPRSTLLRVSRPGDACEMEADRLADHVMLARKAKGPQEESRMPAGEEAEDAPEVVSEDSDAEDEEIPVQRKAAGGAAANAQPASSHAVRDALQSGGTPLDTGTRSFMESRLAFDFSRVRIHSGERAASSARKLDAHAYTVGSDIVFGSGQYRPDTEQGQRVLAHELAHVMQQSKRGVMLNRLTTSVVGGAKATHMKFDPCDWGITDTETVDVTAKATKSGADWIAEPTDLVGHYSMRTRLIPGQKEVTGPAGNTTSANHCTQVQELAALGKCPGGAWYMKSAVKAHEKVHEKRLAPGLKKAAPKITTDFAKIKVADAAGKTDATALAELQALPAWATNVKKARTRWDAEYVKLISGDHAGPTDTAEHKVVDPMVKKICDHAKANAWPACATCPP